MPIRRKDSKESQGNLLTKEPTFRGSAYGCGPAFQILPNLPGKIRRLLRPHPTQNAWNQNVQLGCQRKDPATLLRIPIDPNWRLGEGQEQAHQEGTTTRVEKSKGRQN